MAEKSFQEWTCIEVSDWLKGNGLPDELCEKFEEELVDGAAFMDLTENDVKSMIKPLGHVKRVLRLIRAKVNSEVATATQCVVSSAPPAIDVTGSFSNQSPPTSGSGDTVLVSSTPPVSTHSAEYEGSCESVRSITPTFRDGVPQNYSLPKAFSSAVMGALQKKQMEPKVRSAFVRELVVHMTSYGIRPPRPFCSLVARRIILKYPFLRDAVGNGYASWEKRLVDRVYNVCKSEKRKLDESEGATSAPKRVKLEDRYPPISMVDIPNDATNKRNMGALEKELMKPKPRKSVVLELMEQTFCPRRHFVLHEALCVQEILDKYPALCKPDVIVQEMELVVQCPQNSLLSSFQRKFQTTWVPAILQLAQTFSKASKKALSEPPNYGLEADHLCQIRAVYCLAAIFSNVAKKDKVKKPEHYLIEDYAMEESPEICATEEPMRNSPRIARFQSMDTSADYYVFIEQKVFVKVTSFTVALFIWFAAHYVFNLEYDKYYKNVALFFQEFIFELPEADTKKKNQNYLTAVTELKRISE